MLQLYLTPGKRSGNVAVFTVGPGVRMGGEGMPCSKGRQDSWYPVSTPLMIVGVCQEKDRLFLVTEVI